MCGVLCALCIVGMYAVCVVGMCVVVCVCVCVYVDGSVGRGDCCQA